MRFDRRYLDLILRWLWLIVLAGIVAGAASFWTSRKDKVEYTATARLIVGPGYNNPKPTINDLRTSGQLMQMYAELATTRGVMDEVVHALNLDIDPGKLGGHIDVKANTETLILTVQATDKEPTQAVIIANGVADALKRLPQDSMENIDELVRRQVGEVQAMIDSSNTMIKQLDGQLQAATDLDQQKLIRDQLKEERGRLSENHQTLANLAASLQETFTNRVQIIEPAVEASQTESTLRLNVLVAAAAGMLVAALIALAVEYFDRRVKNTEQLAQAAGLPLVAAIERHGPLTGTGRERLVTKAAPDSRASEGYRRLGTKLVLMAEAGAARAILVCSPGADKIDDSAEVAANLAAALAESGHRVALVDANLHAPRLGEIFGAPERGGLSDALAGKAQRPDGVAVAWAPGLTVVSSGPPSSDAFRLLSVANIADLLEELKAQADLVVVAGPPLLAFAEGLNLAAATEGVLLIVRGGRTNRDVVTDAVAQVQTVGGTALGVVLTGARKGDSVSPSPQRPNAIPAPSVAPPSRPVEAGANAGANASANISLGG
jgi:capsular exopolysaccharide synthesis family protein